MRHSKIKTLLSLTVFGLCTSSRADDFKRFAKAPLGTFERAECSPAEPHAGWKGVAIEAPGTVYFRKNKPTSSSVFATIPVCGLWMLGEAYQSDPDMVRLVAIDKNTGKHYAGPIEVIDLHHLEESPDHPPLTKEEAEQSATIRYFNANLAEVAPLPAKAATYDVFAKVRGKESNHIKLIIAEKK